MTLLGHVKNGRIELDQAAALPEGAAVRVELIDGKPAPIVDVQGRTLGEKLLQYAGLIQDAPADLARQHDHYLHGTPKK